MSQYMTEQLRTVALVGHGASGKTTLAEALLAHGGAIGAAGSVDRGSTVSDFDPLEKTWKHSLRSSIMHLDTPDARIHLIDTPGFPDFIGQAIGALDAVETAAVVVNAQSGIEKITTRMMEWAGKRNLCRLVIVNKIDAENANPEAVLRAVQQAFGRECLPINLPAAGGSKVVDCFFNPSGESDFSSVAAAHQALIDQVVEVDEELMAAYLEKGEVSPEQLHAPFEAALREGHLVPICFTSARNGAGTAMTCSMVGTGAGVPAFVAGGASASAAINVNAGSMAPSRMSRPCPECMPIRARWRGVREAPAVVPIQAPLRSPASPGSPARSPARPCRHRASGSGPRC